MAESDFLTSSLDFMALASDPELLHESERGWSQLYLVDVNGKFRVLKALKPSCRGFLQYETLLRKEFEIAYRLSHPGICETYSFVRHPELGNCIEMEWIDGENLAAILDKGKLSYKLSRDIILQLCDALLYCHRKQVLHRDIKPENIMLLHDGRRVKLIDFGLADSSEHSILKSSCGTVNYVAPEVSAGAAADERSDIYSLGVVISLLHPRFAKVAAKCMKTNPDARYRSIEEVAEAVRHTWRRHPLLWILCSLVLAGGCGLIGMRYLAGGDAGDRTSLEILPAVEENYMDVSAVDSLFKVATELLDQ